MNFTRRRIFKATTIVAGMGIAALALIYFIPAPPSKVVMATAFKDDENAQIFRDIGARNIRKRRHAHGVLSLGTVYDQPFWIFYPANRPLDRLPQLKGKRIAIGPEGSATRHMAEQILGKGGVNSETATFLPFAGEAADKALQEGQADAVWIIGVPEATAVQSFLRNPNVRPMSFPMSEALTRVFPDLARMTLPQGTIDLERIIPSEDVQLIGTKSKVLIRSDLHPEIVQLLLQTMKAVHGGSDLFHRSGEYPNALDSEYTVAPTAIDFYKNGPSFMQRYRRMCKERSRYWLPASRSASHCCTSCRRATIG